METILNDLAAYLWAQSAQIAVLCVVVGLACYVLRKKSAHLRYLLWLLVLGKCLVPSLITVSLAILPQQSEVKEVAADPAMGTLVDIPPQARTYTMSYVPAAVEAIPDESFLAKLSQIPPGVWFAVVWFAGAGVFALIVSAKAIRIHRRLRTKRSPADDDLCREMKELISDHDRSPRMWEVKGIGQPFVWGLFKGDIYLPANFEKTTDRRNRRRILAHELAHVSRFDALVNALQTIAQGIFWFHPLVWIANRTIRAEREKCCDETAIAGLAAVPKDYSTAIVDTLANEYKSTLPTPSLAIAGPVKNIEDRIKTIMKPGRKFHRRPTLIAALSILILAMIIAPTTIALTERQAEATNDNKQEVSKDDVMELVEDFFSNNYRDVTARKSLEWGEPVVDEDGNVSIQYKFEATIWDKDKKIIEQIFTFDNEGKFISAKDSKVQPASETDKGAGETAVKSSISRSVAEFGEGEDFSTPAAAYATINRISASGSAAGWKRASVGRLSSKLGAADSKPPVEWTNVLKNAQILSVYTMGEKAMVVARLQQSFSSEPIVAPIDVRYLEREGGKWLNAGNDRVDSEGQAVQRFKRKTEGDVRSLPGVGSPDENAALPVISVETAPRAASEIDKKRVIIEVEIFSVKSKTVLLEELSGIGSSQTSAVLDADEKQKLDAFVLSESGVHLIANPKLEVFDGGTAKIAMALQADDSQDAKDAETEEPAYEIALEITPRVTEKQEAILLKLELDLKNADGRNDSGEPIIHSRQITSRIGVTAGQSALLLLSDDQKATDNGKENCDIYMTLTPSVVEASVEERGDISERDASGRNRLTAPAPNDFERAMISQVVELAKKVEETYPDQTTHWPAGAALYYVDSFGGQVTVWHYRKLWWRSKDCAEDEVGWGSSELANATGVYYLPDGTPLQSRWSERGGGMKDILVKIGRTVDKKERIAVVHRHALSAYNDLFARDGLTRRIQLNWWENRPLGIIVRVDKPTYLAGWQLGDLKAERQTFNGYDQLLVIGGADRVGGGMFVSLRRPETPDRRPAEAGDQLPAAMIGTWLFDNLAGDDEQMAIFPDGRVVVLYSNGHVDETRLVDGMVELVEYGNAKVKMLAAKNDGVEQHYSNPETGERYIKSWKRIDDEPRTELLRRLSGKAEDDEDKASIQVEMRFLTFAENSLHDIGLDSKSEKYPDIWLSRGVLELKTEAALFSGAVDDRTKVKAPVEGALLDDLHVDLIIKATMAHKEARLLTSPRVVVGDGEEATIRISEETPFIAGYKEDASAKSGEPAAIHDYISTGTELKVTPRISEDGKHFVLDLETILSEVTGYEKRRYKKYRYDVPQVEELKTKCSGMHVPAGKTLLIFTPWPEGASGKGPRNVLMLIKPQIAEGDSKPPTFLPGGSLGGGMGGGFGGGSGSVGE